VAGVGNLKDGPLLAFGLAFVATVGIVVLAAISHPIPAELVALDAALVGGGLGITNPTTAAASSSSVASSTSSSSEELPIDQAGGAAP
jgi:hypothetical protein